MWRPKEWHTPVPDTSTTVNHTMYDIGYRDGYEVGADALLEALKKDYACQYNDKCDKDKMKCYKGLCVIIPYKDPPKKEE